MVSWWCIPFALWVGYMLRYLTSRTLRAGREQEEKMRRAVARAAMRAKRFHN